LVENSHNSVGTVSAIGTTACSGGITGYLNGGTITSSYNTGDVTIPASSSSYAGGIAGNIAEYMGVGGTIENNNNSGKVEATSTNTDAYSGGIAGYVGSSGVIRHSSNSGDVSSTFSGSSTTYSSHAGGIAGRVVNGTVENDNNTGKVKATSNSGTAYSGGIAGRMSNNSKIENAHNYDNVSATSNSANAYSGGIAGYTNNSEIENAHNYDNVSATSNSANAYSGGIAGYMIGGGSVANSHNTDNVSATAEVASGESFAGGIVGFVSGALAEIKTSYNNGEIYAVSDQYSSSGGIVGRVENMNASNISTISNCYNTNYIYASASSSYAGGIVGNMRRGKIEKSYNLGNIKTLSSDWNPHGGGIVADMASSSSIVENCAAINVKIESGSHGRIVGYSSSGSAANNFAYSGMVIGTTGTGHVNGTDKSLDELKTQSTYEDAVVSGGLGGLGWEFGNDDDHPWKMPLSGSAYLYPILYWQE
jgi:hypothetical protein